MGILALLFNIYYSNSKRYKPDFVLETDDRIYLCEVKAHNELNNQDILLKAKAATECCRFVTDYNLAWDEALELSTYSI